MGAHSAVAWTLLGVGAVSALRQFAELKERVKQRRRAEQERLAREKRAEEERLAREKRAEEERLALEAERERNRKQREEVERRCAEIEREYKEDAARSERELQTKRDRCNQMMAQLRQQLQQPSPRTREEQLRLIQDMQKHATSKERLHKWLSQHALKAMDSNRVFPSTPDKRQLWLYYHPDKQAGTSPEWQLLCQEISKLLAALW